MATSESPPAIPEVDPERRAKVGAARESWIRALIDKSRRNNLLYYRDLKNGTLDLTGAGATAMARLLKSEETPLSKLFLPGMALEVAAAKLLEIRSRALMNSEERGIETLFMAMGMATWDSPDGERPPEAAILLVPLKVEARGRGGQNLVLRREGDIQANLVLLHVLEGECGVKLTQEDLIAVLQGDDDGEEFDTAPVSALLARAAKDVPGFRTTDRIVVGNFAFQKTAMVRDLKECEELMARHDLIAAISGDKGASQLVRDRRVPVDPAVIDQTPPADEFLVLDADSSQQLVVRHAIGLQDGTIQGPPGTGKSQTISNLIAELAARGRRVLFVAEKRAALEVVLERLRKEGLEHLALDLHGAEISRRDVMGKLQASLDQLGTVPPVAAEKIHERLLERRERLLGHMRKLYAECAPTGRTVYDVQGHLLRLGPPTFSQTRWQGGPLDALGPDVIEKASNLLGELADLRDLFLRCSESPWNGATLTDGAAARQANTLAAQLNEDWPSLKSALDALCSGALLDAPDSLPRWREMLQLLTDVRATLELYAPAVFRDTKLDELLPRLAPATRSAPVRLWHFLFDADYRSALREAREHRITPKAPAPQLQREIESAADQAKRWQVLSAGRTGPRPTPALAGVEMAWKKLAGAIAQLTPTLGLVDFDAMTLGELAAFIARLAADRSTPGMLPRLHEIERSLDGLGLESLVAEYRKRRSDAAEFVPMLEHAWMSSALDRTMDNDTQLAGFNGRTHDRVVEEFRRLDRERIKIAADRVRRAHAERAVEALNTYAAEADLVRRECRRKFRGMPIRRLLSEAPHVLTALRPCWMASPLSVSQLLPVDRDLFDIVLFDEASQVLPQDAVPALLRAPRAVVAGDRHQLPPTTFFLPEEELDVDPDEEAPTSGFESILDLMSGLFEPWSLDWHYRSRDESLISFSNHHIYADRLVTFPGPGHHKAVQHHLVNSAPIDGQEDSVSAEVAKVVELVLQHANERKDESLGVIALGIKHQQRIERALDAARRDRPELDEFFNESRRERFFVKNLERVQGDERDAIILSVGYGKDRSGKVPYRFGPLLSEGGERRMNVAVTRARNRMTLVSSFDHRDMDPERSKARGVEFLRLYLQFAASEGQVLGDAQGPVVPLNDFEQAVSDALTAKGMHLLPQWGASRYRIDLVAKHPAREGRLVLAIECDGATYHSAQSARDRDRLRQQHLEALGWRFHRIWSTDWFLNREQELERAVKAYEEAVRAADREDDGVAARPARATDGVPAEQTAAPALPAAPARSRRPDIRQRDTIDQYTDNDLNRLVNWIASDGLLRTDEQMLDLMIEELGFERRGTKIVARIEAAIAECRRR